MKIAQFDPKKVRILKTNILEFQANNDVNNPVKKEQIEGFTSSLNIDVGYNLKKRIFRVFISIIMSAKDKKNRALKASGKISVEFIFEVDNLKEFIVKEKKKEKIQAILGIALTGIAYSTMRGIILVKSQETILDGIILPVVDPITMVQSEEFATKTRKIAS